jgi:hypothetical protein
MSFAGIRNILTGALNPLLGLAPAAYPGQFKFDQKNLAYLLVF